MGCHVYTWINKWTISIYQWMLVGFIGLVSPTRYSYVITVQILSYNVVPPQ